MSVHGEVVIIGAGLAGLCAARILNKRHVSCTIFEAADDIGGRVRTDIVRGFLLDRGFQVYLTSYPEGREVLFYESLGFHPFAHGAIVRVGGAFVRIFDPWRHPAKLIATAFSSAATLRDKMRLASLRAELNGLSLDQLIERPEQTTQDALREWGFSGRIVERFFRPFYGGVFLDPSLQTSSRMFDFTFRMFASGDAVLPDAGMGSIPRHIAARLRETDIRLNTKVVRADENGVTLAGGQRVMARAVIIATDQTAAAELLGQPTSRPWRGTTCHYFAADKPPVNEPTLVLDGEARGPINHLAVVSNVCRSYAPPGAHLVCANVVGEAANDPSANDAVVDQLCEWFGESARRWERLASYRIPHSLPDQTPPALAQWQRTVRIRKGLYVCGDHVDQASINGAMTSGRRAAEAVLADFSSAGQQESSSPLQSN